ncbi:hypothetical protein FQB35_13555 [Crassaminicella thermophila]|uniref:TATA-box binding n=1 Tax=Crassaminicella thermophila TaxID=2599308 RepID=A0A5C0SFG9_CRATE|nr:YwmB family TATA-box binding protein [Crassaminicella thermophila]QEK13213.1 hypothetical protein FQB35_13555 [Crassaminicella thermophila]
MFAQFKKISLHLLLFISILCLQFFNTSAMTKEEGMLKAFKNSEATVEEVNMNAYVNMNNVLKTPSEGKKIGLEIAKKMQIKDETLKDTSAEGDTQIYIEGKSEEGGTIRIIVQGTEYEDIKETNLVIDVVENKLIDLNVLSEKIKEALGSYGKVIITSCITGSYAGELEDAEKEKVAKKIMESLQAEEIEGFREENIISIVGFSKKIKDYISYDGHKVNINIALRYNSYEKKTYLWIATPLITIGY